MTGGSPRSPDPGTPIRSDAAAFSRRLRWSTLGLSVAAAAILVAMFAVSSTIATGESARQALFVLLAIGLTCTLALGLYITRIQVERLESTFERVQERHRELIERARERARTAEAYAHELEQMNLDLERFAHAASHDLREPLRMISAYLQLLEERYTDVLDEEGREYIGYAVRGSQRLHMLIGGLLAYSRAGRSDRPLVPVSLDKALDDALGNLKMQLEETGATVERDPLPEVRGDLGQLAQLFQNLVSNAVKFRGGEPPRIEIEAVRGDEMWTITVRDNGIGFDAEREGRIFEIFQRVHNGDREGSGIGLAICKRIVDRHGGRIWAEAKPGSGATFHFTLPKVEAKPEEDPETVSRTIHDRTSELV